MSLSERVRRINAHCLALGKKNVIVVSIHVNAAGNGTKWLNATGWSVFTCSGQTESDKLAECLCESAIKNFPGRRIRTDCQMVIVIGRKISISCVSLGVQMC